MYLQKYERNCTLEYRLLNLLGSIHVRKNILAETQQNTCNYMCRIKMEYENLF